MQVSVKCSTCKNGFIRDSSAKYDKDKYGCQISLDKRLRLGAWFGSCEDYSLDIDKYYDTILDD